MGRITVATVHTNPLTRRGWAPVEVEHTDRVERLLAYGALVEVESDNHPPEDSEADPEAVTQASGTEDDENDDQGQS